MARSRSHDHRVFLIDYADELTERLRDERYSEDFWKNFLDIALYRRTGMPEVYRVEFLLTCGGPTVRVTVDESSRVLLYHSWGKDHEDKSQTHGNFRSSDEEFWRDLADEYSDMFPAD